MMSLFSETFITHTHTRGGWVCMFVRLPLVGLNTAFRILRQFIYEYLFQFCSIFVARDRFRLWPLVGGCALFVGTQ